MNRTSKKSKLKRDRKKDFTIGRNTLFPDHQTAVIETLSASSDSPAMRRFVPIQDVNLKEFGVIDWRSKTQDKIDNINFITDKIICADSELALKLLPDNCIDCIITSPPYWNIVDYGFENQIGDCDYQTYLEQLLRVWRECERILVPNGKLCINTPIMPISKKVIQHQHTRHLKNLNNDIEASILSNLTLKRFSLYIWQKQTTEKMFGSYPYPPNLYEQNTVEFINVFVKDGKPKTLPKYIKDHSKINDKEWMNLTRQIWPLYPEDVKRVSHPAPFPESLPNRLIALYTFASVLEENDPFLGDIVLDPFNGSGATCVAAKKLRRRYIGIDLSSHFCITAQKRLNNCFIDKKIFLIADKNNENNNNEMKNCIIDFHEAVNDY